MLPPLTDFIALLGLDLVLCAGCVRLLAWQKTMFLSPSRMKWAVAFLFLLSWWPIGAANLPLIAYVRGISSDLSITLVALASWGLCNRLFDFPAVSKRERGALGVVVAAAALLLYPLALGWGDWDPYRLGWGSPGMLVVLLLISLVCCARGFYLVPLLIALALVGWTAGVLESSNLWDYLIDPWLAVASLFQCARAGLEKLMTAKRSNSDTASLLSR